jgi:ubiquitin-activating enzyme E1 C
MARPDETNDRATNETVFALLPDRDMQGSISDQPVYANEHVRRREFKAGLSIVGAEALRLRAQVGWHGEPNLAAIPPAAMSHSDWPGRYSHVDQILDRPGPRTDPDFLAGDGVHFPQIRRVVCRWSQPQVKSFLRENCKVLVIGAGGLGCEILANLALTGFKDIHVIDMDTIDISNLNRQFLFRQKDVGRPKAIVASEFIEKRVPGVKVSAFVFCIQHVALFHWPQRPFVYRYHGKIQDKDEEYYMQFNIIICGLDSVEARRWINATLVNMVDPENPDSLKPLIDGGTEGM